VTSEPPPGESESGLREKQGAFTTSLPWILRFLLAAAIGAAMGFIVSVVFAPRTVGSPGGWTMVASMASAATLLSLRKIHAWHLSTFADGMLVGLIAWPILAFLMVVLTWRGVGMEAFLAVVLRGVGFWIILVPSGWIAGFVYHLVLSLAERARSDDDEAS